MEAFLANRKSARAWRGELSSSSMVEIRASAIAWSDTARPRSRDLLSRRMVDLEGDGVERRSQTSAASRNLTADWPTGNSKILY